MTDTSPGTPSYVPPNDLEKLREAVQRDMNLVMDLREEVERLRVDLTSWRLRGNEATEKCWALEAELARLREENEKLRRTLTAIGRSVEEDGKYVP
jgi:chromosome segregation ATPase